MTDKRHARAIDARHGFSLIEVMVATLIMLVIVIMIGAVFRQSVSSWDSGYAKAEGGMLIRTVVGGIQRELSTAVDGRRFGTTVWPNKYKDVPIGVEDNELTFICVKDRGEKGSSNDFYREYMLVTYERSGASVTRKAVRLKYNDSGGGRWQEDSGAGATESSVIYSSTQAGESTRGASYSATFKFAAGPAVNSNDPGGVKQHESDEFENYTYWNIPYVAINVELTRESSISGIEVRSNGKDRVKDTADDIIIGSIKTE